MPEDIVARILRLPGYGVYAWEAVEAASSLTLWIRPTASAPSYVCGGCGISVRDIHSWTERRLRDLPWGTWQVWLVVEVHRVRCRRCGVRTERLPFVTGKAHSTTRLEAAVAQACESAPVSRVPGSSRGQLERRVAHAAGITGAVMVRRGTRQPRRSSTASLRSGKVSGEKCWPRPTRRTSRYA